MSSNIVDSQTYSGIKYKKLHVADLSEKYGQGQCGLIADEPIKKGELILRNDRETSIFYPFDDKRCSLTLDEFFELLNKQTDSQIKDYLLRYSLQYVDKNVFVPQNYQTRQTMDFSALLNHSCEPNCTSTFTDEVIAIQDIPIGTILTVDYGIGITDNAKLIPFQECHCGADSCAGTNVFQRYKQKIDQLQ